MAGAQGRGDEATSAGNWMQSRKILDLEDLSFAHGSPFIGNKV